MPPTSDITIDKAKFLPNYITEETVKTNQLLETVTRKGPHWYEVGVAKYRQMRETGDTPLPAPVYLPKAEDSSIPSRDTTRDIPVRIYHPDNGQPSQGIFLHFHGGGFVHGSHKHSDERLRSYANTGQLTAISVGYRLAPEDPFPAGAQDCYDAAEYLFDNAERDYGAMLLFMGGESSGANLTALTTFHLMRTRPACELKGLILPFGCYDLTLNMPQISSAKRPIVISYEAMKHFSDAYVPNMSIEDKRDPSVSPLYEDLQALVAAEGAKKLPPALFLCGTQDPLLEDTLMMSMKWQIAGGEAVVKIWPGEAHGFTSFPTKSAREASSFTQEFLQYQMEC